MLNNYDHNSTFAQFQPIFVNVESIRDWEYEAAAIFAAVGQNKCKIFYVGHNAQYGENEDLVNERVIFLNEAAYPLKNKHLIEYSKAIAK